MLNEFLSPEAQSFYRWNEKELEWVLQTPEPEEVTT